jgi:hypothetical protein
MQIKQEVGECWVGVILFACVYGGALYLTHVSDDPITCLSLWVCALGAFLQGSHGGEDSPELRGVFGETP